MNSLTPKIRFKGFTEDWEQCKFGNYGSISMNKRIFKSQTFEHGEIPFYKIGTFGGKADAYISKELFEEYKAKYPYPTKGDILVSASGSIGKTVEYSGELAYFQDSNIVWLNHSGNLNNLFLKQLYSVVKWNGLEGSTIKRLYNSNFLDTDICVPNLIEQQRLGDYFNKLDNLITIYQQKYDKLKQLKNSLLDKMFPLENDTTPKIRFKGFTEDWEQRKLDDICSFFKGIGLSWDDISKDGIYPCILYGNLYTNYGMIADKIVHKTNTYSPSFLISQKYDVLIPGDDTTPNGLARATSIETDGVILGGSINVLRSNSYNGSFLSIALNRNKKKMIPLITGTTVRHLNNTSIKTIELSLTKNNAEQLKIRDLFYSMDSLSILYQRKIDILKNLKKAFLNKMFVQ